MPSANFVATGCSIMCASSKRTRTKDDLRAEAIERFRVSKSAFDVTWTWPSKRVAIDTGMNRHHDLDRSRGARYSLILVKMT